MNFGKKVGRIGNTAPAVGAGVRPTANPALQITPILLYLQLLKLTFLALRRHLFRTIACGTFISLASKSARVFFIAACCAKGESIWKRFQPESKSLLNLLCGTS
jgi:hypothetical protein